MADEKTNGLDFADEDPYYWRFMDDKSVTKGVDAMVKEINETEDQLKKMVPDNAYTKTQTYIQQLAFMVLGNDGFIHQLYERNKEFFPANGVKPDWYGIMSPEDKILYGQCEKHFVYLPMMDAACREAADMIMSLNLLQGFRLLSIKDNLTDCDMFTREDYKQIVDDAYKVGVVINMPWDVMERKAENAEKFYQQNLGKYGKYELNTKYREERERCYLNYVSDQDFFKRMRSDSRGNFFVNPYTETLMSILDTYTQKVSDLYKDNIEGRTEKALEKVIAFDVKQLSHLSKEMNDLALYPVVAALKSLTQTAKEFVQEVWDTFDGFKKASDGSPYCFMQKIGANSIKKAYSYAPKEWNAMEHGTGFQSLYQSMANALTEHGVDFVYNHGHPELK